MVSILAHGQQHQKNWQLQQLQRNLYAHRKTYRGVVRRRYMGKTLLYIREQLRPQILLLDDPRLLDMIETGYGLLEKLHSCEVLNGEKVEIIRTESTHTGAVRILLNEVNKMSREQQDLFLSALDSTRQSHVTNFIRNEGRKPTAGAENWPLYVYKQRLTIRTCWSELLETIDSHNGLLDELFAIGCIDFHQKLFIDSTNVGAQRNDRLLNLLLRKSYDDYRKFIQCLIKTKQHHVVSMLETDCRFSGCQPLTAQQKLKLSTNYSALVELIDFNVQLSSRLYAANCITKRQGEFIQSASHASESNRRLLDIIMRGCQSDFEHFIKCLQETGQQNVSDLLLGEGVTTNMIARTNGSINLKVHEKQAVDQFMVVMSNSTAVNRQLMMAKVREFIEQLEAHEVQMISMQPVNSIKLYYVVNSLSGLLYLNDLYITGRLKSIVQQIIDALLGDEQLVTVNGVHWSKSDYCHCAQQLFDKNRMPLSSRIHQLALQVSPGAATEPTVITLPSLIDQLPHELIELLLIKAVGQLFDAMKTLTSRAVILSLTTVQTVCCYWRETLSCRQRNRHLLKRYFSYICAPYSFCSKLLTSLHIEGEAEYSIVGIAEFRSKLYLARSKVNLIKVFSVCGLNYCDQGEEIKIPELQWPADMVACDVTESLYVSDYKKRCIWRVSLSTSTDKEKTVMKFIVAEHYEPFKLSIQSSRLLVTARDGTTLYLYNCIDGELMKVVKLPDYMWARDAVEAPDGNVFVCHKNGRSGAVEQRTKPGVSEVPREGHVPRVYSGTKEFTEPVYLTVGRANHILVCDRRNMEVVHLDDELKFKQIVLSDRDLNGQPYRAYRCEGRRLLYICYYASSLVDVYAV